MNIIIMFAHPDVWLEDESKRVVCDFPSAWPGDEGRDFEDRKALALKVKTAINTEAEFRHRDAGVLPRDGVLHTDGWGGRQRQDVIVVAETRKRYRVKA